MPRLGQNPAKSVDTVAKPEKVTVAVLSYIPFLHGYYKDSLKVLKTCLTSILANTDSSFDLMVFDNASCTEVVDYLTELHRGGEINYLVSSKKNLGKVGAWNLIFGSAPGEFIAYTDSDVYFYPGWLSKHLAIFESFPEVGTVTGLPRRGRREYSRETIRRIEEEPGFEVQRGKFIPEAWMYDHARSLGKMDQVQRYLERDDILVTSNGVSAYVTETHFQFVIRGEVVKRYLPFQYSRPMGEDVSQLDRELDRDGLLRLAVAERVTMHLGNTLDLEMVGDLPDVPVDDMVLIPDQDPGRRPLRRILRSRPLKGLFLRIYDWIFDLYYKP